MSASHTPESPIQAELVNAPDSAQNQQAHTNESLTLEQEQLDRGSYLITRRQLLRTAALVAGTTAITGWKGFIDPRIQQATSERYPYRPAEIHLANPQASVLDPRIVRVVFGGFGQMTSKNSALQSAEASDDKVYTAYWDYSTRGLSLEDLGSKMWDFIEKHEIAVLQMQGESAGGVIGIGTALAVQNIIRTKVVSGNLHPSTTFPHFEANMLNCTPNSVQSANLGELLKIVRWISDASGHSPSFVDKFLVSYLRGGRKPWEWHDLISPEDFANHWNDANNELFNDSSPYTAGDIGRIVLDFDSHTVLPLCTNLYRPDAVIFYGRPSNTDTTVDNEISAKGWQQDFASIGIHDFEIIDTGNSGHDSSYDFNEALHKQERFMKLIREP